MCSVKPNVIGLPDNSLLEQILWSRWHRDAHDLDSRFEQVKNLRFSLNQSEIQYLMIDSIVAL